MITVVTIAVEMIAVETIAVEVIVVERINSQLSCEKAITLCAVPNFNIHMKK